MQRNYRAETLLEVVATLVITGLAIVGVVTAIGVLLGSSSLNARQTEADLVLRSWAESIKSPGTTYAPCASTTTSGYSASALGVPVPARMSVSLVSVEHVVVPSGAATSSGFTPVPATCSSASDPGLQRIVLQVRTSDQRVTRTLGVVKSR